MCVIIVPVSYTHLGNAPEQWEIVQDIRVNGGDTKKAQSDASALLRENADIKCFFGCNNTSTVGIVNTLFEEERTDVVLVGFDLADETKQMLQNPEYHAVTVLQKMCIRDRLFMIRDPQEQKLIAFLRKK